MFPEAPDFHLWWCIAAGFNDSSPELITNAANERIAQMDLFV